jgi:hypothetical protein
MAVCSDIDRSVLSCGMEGRCRRLHDYNPGLTRIPFLPPANLLRPSREKPGLWIVRILEESRCLTLISENFGCSSFVDLLSVHINGEEEQLTLRGHC